MFCQKFFRFGLFVCLFGCASNSKHWTSTENSIAKGRIVGNIQVEVNGEIANENCKIDFASQNDTDMVKLEKSGHIEMDAPLGKIAVQSITCKTGFFGIPVTHNFAEDEFYFYNNGESKISYIGHLKINWKTLGPSPLIFIISVPLAYLIGGSTDEMKIKVIDKLNSISYRSLATVGKISKKQNELIRAFPKLHKDLLDESKLNVAKLDP